MSLYDKARSRSVDNLQVLYAFVVGLAVTEALRRLLTDPVTGSVGVGWSEAFVFVSLIVTVVPFFHGANRYLDASYVTGERGSTNVALMVDFFLLFIQGIWFFALALLADDVRIFYTALAGLLVFDIVWVSSTLLHGRSKPGEPRLAYTKWMLVNVAASALLFLFSWSDLIGWASPLGQEVFLMVVVVARTVFDYVYSWDFYYPSPAPAPESVARSSHVVQPERSDP